MEVRALGQSGQCPLWGQECQDSSDQGRPRGSGGQPPSHWPEATEAQDPVQGREASW